MWAWEALSSPQSLVEALMWFRVNLMNLNPFTIRLVFHSDFDDEDEDPELQRIREKRMMEMKAAHSERQENLSKGHGQYR